MNEAENHFRDLSAALFRRLRGDEVLLLNHYGEDSDFARFNQSRMRSAGKVHQLSLQLDLIRGQRGASAVMQLTGELEQDLEDAGKLLAHLRDQLPHLPTDPFLHYATEPVNTLQRPENRLPPASAAADNLVRAASGRDMVGSLASGKMSFGFANSLGQFNWHSDYSFLANWSVYGGGDAAVKQNYEGVHWDPEFVANKIALADKTLELLQRPVKTLSPGRYRVFLEPTALYELLQVFAHDGFSLKSHRTEQSCLLRLGHGDSQLDPRVTLREDHAGGRTPAFTRAGFIKPDQVELVRGGHYLESLAGSRSAREYGVAVNCDAERPHSLVMDGGDLHQDQVMEALDTGIYIGNLWYANLSDRSHCRITGLTRFTCLWVENGRPVAPINVMRFDESLYHILGEGLEALTREHEPMFDPSTYERRSEAGASLPGALVNNFTLTL